MAELVPPDRVIEVISVYILLPAWITAVSSISILGKPESIAARTSFHARHRALRGNMPKQAYIPTTKYKKTVNMQNFFISFPFPHLMRRLKFRNTALSILKPYILYLQFIIISANFGNSIFYYKIAGTAIMAYCYAYSLFAPQLTLNMRRKFAFDEYACLATLSLSGVSSSR
jgi:hypothetical protein